MGFYRMGGARNPQGLRGMLVYTLYNCDQIFKSGQTCRAGTQTGVEQCGTPETLTLCNNALPQELQEPDGGLSLWHVVRCIWHAPGGAAMRWQGGKGGGGGSVPGFQPPRATLQALVLGPG